tara:strand:- start:460 stop:1089 length:630 start_codon:yes stop_codon:yes gene_type:complete
MSHRRLEYLHRNRIIYRRYPIIDKPDQVFSWGGFYQDGTHECYELFRSKAKITTYRSLKWHLLVLWYLNDDMEEKILLHLAKFICDKDNGFITFTIPPGLLDKIVKQVVIQDFDKPPKNKVRKVIFKDGCGLSISEKLRIVGSLIGRSRKVTKEAIYNAMCVINSNNESITIAKLAYAYDCSTRTIHRNMCNELKLEKQKLNKQLHEKI